MRVPTLSIIVPAWNTSNSIYTLVNSILKQSYRDFELIIIDDGSTDDTLSILLDIEKKDRRVRVYAKNNGGPSSARNLGLDKSVGKYIQFFDADDEVAPGALGLTTSAIINSDSDLVVSGWRIDIQTPNGLITDRGRLNPPNALISENIKDYVLESLGTNGMLYNLWNKLFRSSIIRDNKLRFNEDISFGEDLIFAMKYFQIISTIQTIPDVTYHYRESSTGMFGKSALNVKYRRINSEELTTFAGNPKSRKTSDLLHWIEWRWLLSFWRIAIKSDKSYRQKVSLIKENIGGEYIIARNARFIGYKKLILEYIASILRHTPHILVLAMYILSRISGFASRLKRAAM